MIPDFDPLATKPESESRILALDGQICEWLPSIEREHPRDAASVCDRALTLHGMLQLAFGAPKPVIHAWLSENELLSALSRRERELLANPPPLDEQTKANLLWSIEALWAFAWIGSLIPELPIEHPVGNNLASLLPDLRRNEPATDFRSRFVLRPYETIYRTLDLYYRAHWYARDGRLRNHPTGVFNLDIIMERRKALEWAADGAIEDWDNTPDST